MRGREVEILASGYHDTGYHHVIWNASQHASGVYFVKMSTQGFVDTQKMLLVK